MNEMKKNMRRVFWLYFLLFAMLVVYLCKFIFLDRSGVVNTPHNPRLLLENKAVLRGEILDATGQVLASSQPRDAKTRSYPYGRVFSHVVGYADYHGAGLSGIEQKFNFELQNAGKEIIQRIGNILTGAPVRGNSLVLTLDAELQSLSHKLLGDRKGAIVMVEPSTGKILSMVSYPDFDPNTIGQEWDELRSDNTAGPLLNRAAQGKYPPGSVFKIVTAAAALEYIPDVFAYSYDCTGSVTFADNKIRCYDSTSHGTEDLGKAFALSCNTFFAELGIKIGPQNMRAESEKLYFNKAIPFALETAVGSFMLDELSGEAETIETAIGQGRTMTTPLQMAMITSAVANGGLMMKPYVVDHSLTYGGGEVNKVMPEAAARVFSAETASTLAQMMSGVMEHGTGKVARPEGYTSAGKTGSAENPAGDDHGWFVGFAPADDPEIAVCVILENIGGSSKVLGIAKELLEAGVNR